MAEHSNKKEDARAYHSDTADSLVELFESDAKRGLSLDEVRRRLEHYGSNELPQESGAGALRIILHQFTDPLVYILLIAAGVSLAIGSVSSAVFIAAVLLINATVGFFQEFQAESSAQALQEVIRIRPQVLRDGERTEVEAAELVPGDIVLLDSGDAVPADLRLLESSNLQTDESMLTGESTPVDKDADAELEEDTPLAQRSTLLHSGSSVMNGRARGIVVRTGVHTEIGNIADSLASSKRGTPPLVQKLKRMTNWIAAFTMVAVAGVALIQFFRGQEPAQIFTLAVALAVAAIPAGLPVAITVALSVASARMAKRNVIVRRLAAVEGLGSCTLIASDKTGTLTANQLTVQRVWVGKNRTAAISGEGHSLQGEITREDGEALDEDTREALRRFAVAATLANEGELTVEDNEVTETRGDSTDLAFLVLAEKLELDRSALGEEYTERERIPFESSARFGAVFNEHEGSLLANVKGAPEKIMEMCQLSDEERQAIEEQGKIWAGEGCRLLAVAGGEVRSADENALQELDFLGLAGTIDPVREEVPEAIERCAAAGVQVRMITGDHPTTALAIGRHLGLTQDSSDTSGTDNAEEDSQVLTGAALSEGNTARIAEARVFARVEPLQKTDIVEYLKKERGDFVAVTGDGVNDAPALRRANIGIAMGESGTDVARSAGDLILTDDNFASIVPGIEEGRTAYDNVRKVVWLLLATGAAEVLLFFLALAFGLPIPLTAVQLLWLNMVTNGIQDVGLAFEKTEPDVLDRPPRAPDEPIFNRAMIEQVLGSGIYMALVAFGVYFYLHSSMNMGESEARNLTLLLMVLFENAHVFSCRSERRSLFRVPLRNNPLLIGAVILAQGLHISAMYIPGLKDVLQIQPVSPMQWLTLFGIAITLLVFDEGVKWVKAKRRAPAAKSNTG